MCKCFKATGFYCRSSSHPVLSLQSKNEHEASLYHHAADQAAVPKDANMSTEETNRKYGHFDVEETQF